MTPLQAVASLDFSTIEQFSAEWKLVREAIIAPGGFYFFTKCIWMMRPPAQNLMTWRCHGPLCLLMEAVTARQIKRLLVSDPRRTLKTSIVTIAHPNWELARKAILGEDPCTRYG